jgi:hypothetical protein
MMTELSNSARSFFNPAQSGPSPVNSALSYTPPGYAWEYRRQPTNAWKQGGGLTNTSSFSVSWGRAPEGTLAVLIFILSNSPSTWLCGWAYDMVSGSGVSRNHFLRIAKSAYEGSTYVVPVNPANRRTEFALYSSYSVTVYISYPFGFLRPA